MLQQRCYPHHGRRYSLLRFVLYLYNRSGLAVRAGEGVSVRVCEGGGGEMEPSPASSARPWGSVKAARPYTIAPQRADGDRETSIREAPTWTYFPEGCAEPGRHL